MASLNIVVVSDSLETQQAFASVLGPWGLAPILASTACEAETILRRHPVSLIFCSDELPNDGIDGLIRRTRFSLSNSRGHRESIYSAMVR